jgi:hypothetical protein
MDPNSDEILQSKRFLAQSSLYVKLLDTVVDMLGPDIEMLSEILEEMGEKHYKIYGVSHEMYLPMGEALYETFQEKLGDEFTPDMLDVWRDVWAELSGDMSRRELQELAEQRKRLVKSTPPPMATTNAVRINGARERGVHAKEVHAKDRISQTHNPNLVHHPDKYGKRSAA